MTRSSVVFILSVLLVLIFGSAVWAADKVAESPIGKYVRIQADSSQQHLLISGTLTDASDSSITLLVDSANGQSREFLLTDVKSVQVREGRHGHFWKGALIGSITGLIGSAAFAPNIDGYLEELVRGMVIAGGTVGGFAIGGAIGAAIRTDRWEPVPVQELGSASFMPLSGVQLSLTLRF